MTTVEIRTQLQKIIAETDDEDLLKDLHAVIGHHLRADYGEISNEMKSFVNERIEDYKANPKEEVNWDELRTRLQRKSN